MINDQIKNDSYTRDIVQRNNAVINKKTNQISKCYELKKCRKLRALEFGMNKRKGSEGSTRTDSGIKMNERCTCK